MYEILTSPISISISIFPSSNISCQKEEETDWPSGTARKIFPLKYIFGIHFYNVWKTVTVTDYFNPIEMYTRRGKIMGSPIVTGDQGAIMQNVTFVKIGWVGYIEQH